MMQARPHARPRATIAAACTVLSVLLAAALPLAATAAEPAPAPAPDPLDAKAPVPPLQHRSALADYRPGDDARVPWRQANDEVDRIGGWRAYAREGARALADGDAAGRPAASSPAPTPAAPDARHAPGQHGGHAQPAQPGTQGSHGKPHGGSR